MRRPTRRRPQDLASWLQQRLLVAINGFGGAGQGRVLKRDRGAGHREGRSARAVPDVLHVGLNV